VVERRYKMMNKTKRIEFRLTEKEYNKVKAYCEKRNITMTQLILERLELELKLQEETKITPKKERKRALKKPRFETSLT